MRYRKKRGNGSGLKIVFFLAFIFLIFWGIYSFFTSKMFESNAPKISLPSEIYWNLKTPIKLSVSDDSGIKNVKVYLTDGEREIPILQKEFDIPQQEFDLDVKFPKEAILDKRAKFKLNVEANDISKWNFFSGNSAKISSDIVIDTKRPNIYVLNQSYKISKGGSAVVVFKVSDEKLKDVKIQTNFGKEFKPTTYIKDGYYASLVAWPVEQNDFSAYVVAKDMAGNESKSRIRYYLQDRKYKESTIKLTKEFIDGKITDLVDQYSKDHTDMDYVQKFKFVNETLRNENEKVIEEITSKVPEDIIQDFVVNPFRPLSKGAAVASFGDHRFYTWEDKPASQSWHLGLDLASTSHADIIENNSGEVVLVKENGIYGLNLGIYYGFGLYTIYGHCSDSKLNVGDKVKSGDLIANTGSSGLAFGDHLHFGVLVQGIEVRPEEWMDKKWMKENIFSILDNAKKVILNDKAE